MPEEVCRVIWTDEPNQLDRTAIERLAAVLGFSPSQLFQPGLLQCWTTIIALDTLQYWDEENLSAAGKSFVPIGIDVGDRELVMAFPHLLNTHATGATQEEQKEWENKQYQYKEAVRSGELILPPENFPTWAPFAQTKDDYLANIEELTRKEMAESPRQKHLLQKGDRSLIEAYLKLIQPYCEKLEAHYRQNGYKKLPLKRDAERQIAWTVQAHVLNKTYEETIRVVEDINPESPSESVTPQNVRARVNEVLKILGLAPRKDRKADRKRSD